MRFPALALVGLAACAEAPHPAAPPTPEQRAAYDAQLQQQVAQQNGHLAPAPAGSSTVTDETTYRQAQEQLVAWCASDRAERRAAVAKKAEAEAERGKKADEAKTRSDYIKKNCKMLMKPSGPPTVCVDDEGFLRDCTIAGEAYVECPASGPTGLRGIIGQGVASNASPSRAARGRTAYVGNATAPAPEPTKDERCRTLDAAAQ